MGISRSTTSILLQAKNPEPKLKLLYILKLLYLYRVGRRRLFISFAENSLMPTRSYISRSTTRTSILVFYKTHLLAAVTAAAAAAI